MNSKTPRFSRSINTRKSGPFGDVSNSGIKNARTIQALVSSNTNKSISNSISKSRLPLVKSVNNNSISSQGSLIKNADLTRENVRLHNQVRVLTNRLEKAHGTCQEQHMLVATLRNMVDIIINDNQVIVEDYQVIVKKHEETHDLIKKISLSLRNFNSTLEEIFTVLSPEVPNGVGTTYGNGDEGSRINSKYSLSAQEKDDRRRLSWQKIKNTFEVLTDLSVIMESSREVRTSSTQSSFADAMGNGKRLSRNSLQNRKSNVRTSDVARIISAQGALQESDMEVESSKSADECSQNGEPEVTTFVSEIVTNKASKMSEILAGSLRAYSESNKENFDFDEDMYERDIVMSLPQCSSSPFAHNNNENKIKSKALQAPIDDPEISWLLNEDATIIAEDTTLTARQHIHGTVLCFDENSSQIDVTLENMSVPETPLQIRNIKSMIEEHNKRLKEKSALERASIVDHDLESNHEHEPADLEEQETELDKEEDEETSESNTKSIKRAKNKNSINEKKSKIDAKTGPSKEIKKAAGTKSQGRKSKKGKPVVSTASTRASLSSVSSLDQINDASQTVIENTRPKRKAAQKLTNYSQYFEVGAGDESEKGDRKSISQPKRQSARISRGKTANKKKDGHGDESKENINVIYEEQLGQTDDVFQFVDEPFGHEDEAVLETNVVEKVVKKKTTGKKTVGSKKPKVLML